MRSVLGYKNRFGDDHIVGAGALQAHDIPGVFNIVLGARYQKSPVTIPGNNPTEQRPAAVVGARAPAPAAAQHKAALGHFGFGANGVVGTADQRVGIVGVDLFLRCL